MTRIFISYDRDDRPLTRQLANQLRRVYGHDDVWFDENIYGGADWWQEIRKQIAVCDIFIFLMSEESLVSPYCEKERSEAERLKKEILPIRIAPIKQIPDSLRQIQYVDMSEGAITVDNFTELNAAIRQISRRRRLETMQMPLAQQPKRSARLALVGVPILMLALMLAGLLITAPQPPFQGELTYASGRSTTMNLFARQGGFAGVLSNLTGQNPRGLNGQIAAGSPFDWANDGSRVVFTNLVDGQRQIFRMNADGSDLLMLTDAPEASSTDPDWSPNGEQILFTSDRDGDLEIYVMNADGGDERNLSLTSEADDAFAAWSPDGTQIIFASDRDGDWDIYLMNADGSGTVLLTENNIDDQSPAWSPDGTQITFQSNRVRKLGPGSVPGSGGAITARNWDIYVMDANGDGALALTRSPAADRFPVWSPDGAQIAFVSDRNGDNDIYLKNLNDRNRDILLIDDVEGDPFPVWRG